MKKIVQREDPVLRHIAVPVDFKKLGKAKLATIIADMKSALHAEDDGVAIAAPQIGVSLRIFVVSKKAFEIIDEKKKTESDEKAKKTKAYADMVFVNPVILKLSKEKKSMEEGCLSVRWLYGEVSRSVKATVEAENEHGQKFTIGASGLLAQIFQHEIDHLDGVLFIDKAKHLEDIPPKDETPAVKARKVPKE